MPQAIRKAKQEARKEAQFAAELAAHSTPQFRRWALRQMIKKALYLSHPQPPGGS